MGFKDSFSAAIEKTGSAVLLIKRDESFLITACVQPVMSYTEREASTSGLGNTDKFRFYACHGSIIEQGDEIIADDTRYTVLRSEIIGIGGEPLYITGTLRRCEDDGE